MLVKTFKVNEGDILAIFDVGTYGFSMIQTISFKLKQPSEVLVSDEPHETNKSEALIWIMLRKYF